MAMLVYEGNQVELTGECVLGRQRECGIVIRDGAASRKHARIFQAEGAWWVEDLDSANGSKLNGARFEGRRGLRNGDAIRIGEAEVQFHCSELESAPEAKPATVRVDPQSLEGRDIAGYVIGKLMGRSGMGFLYRATQTSLQRQVAFKVFARKVVEDDTQFAERFLAMASKAGSLRHDGFVQMHENGVEDGLVWYSMELIQGDTLASLLEREGRFAPELALLACERVAMAMSEAHKAGIVHRDLNPRTLMLNGEGKVKILDLGIAAMLGRGRDRNQPAFAWYAAPDALPTAEAQPADDTYALGCVLYHLLVGSPPFTGATADEVRKAHVNAEIPSMRKALPALPASADTLLQGMLTKNRDWRLADMAAIATALREVRDGLAGGGSAQGQAERMLGRAEAVKQRREQTVLRRTITMSVLGLLILVGFLVVPRLLPSPQPLQIIAPVPVQVAPSQRPVVQPVAPPVPPVATVDPAIGLIRDLRARLAHGTTLGWSKLEAEAATLADQLPAGSPASVELRLVRQQLEEDAEAWYRAELARMPTSGAGAAGARLTALSHLRDEAGSAERADADVRYQEELAILMQRLSEARRQARRALEAGQPATLPGIAAALVPVFAGTPVTGLQRQFAGLCAEAAGVSAFWNTDWRTTGIAFERQRGDRALAAGAALLLCGDVGRAKRVLLGDPQLAVGALMHRREALMGGLAAVLTFDEPGDMQYLDVLNGEPALVGGALVGPAGEAASLASTVPIGGADWMTDMSLSLAARSAEVVISCLAGGEATLMLRLAENRLLIRHQGAEQSVSATVAGQRRIRLSSRAGALRVVLDGREVARFDHGDVPEQAQLRIEIAGSAWQLHELQVVGGQ
jgi:hypothetical protein